MIPWMDTILIPSPQYNRYNFAFEKDRSRMSMEINRLLLRIKDLHNRAHSLRGHL